MQTREEVKNQDQEIAEKILTNPARYSVPGELGKIDYSQLIEEFGLSLNRSYRIKFHVEKELAKRAHKKS